MQSLTLTYNESISKPVRAAGFRAIFPCGLADGVFVSVKVDDLYKVFPNNNRPPVSDLILATRICV
jgi:hypothetical protein